MADDSSANVEREKTKRTLIIAASTTIVGLTALILFFNNISNRKGEFQWDQSGVKLSLDTPITEQVGTTTKQVSAFQTTIPVTDGVVADSIIQAVVKQGLKNGIFNGQNLVDTTAGFLLSSDSPGKWKVSREPGKSSTITSDSTEVKVEVSSSTKEPIATHVKRLVDSLAKVKIAAKTQVVDSTTGTTLVWFANKKANVNTCIKVTDVNGQRIIATGTSPNNLAANAALMKVVSSVTPIQRISAAGKISRTSTLQRR